MDLNALARGIITQNEYFTLATIDENGKAWTCILAYAYGPDFTLYFVSLPTAQHSKHIVARPEVAFTIFDSHQGFGKGVGIQGVGKVRKVDASDKKVVGIYFGRKFPYGDINNEFTVGLTKMLANGTYSFYALSPKSVWVNDPHADTDKRVEVFLT